jgi:signal peptidase I
MHNCGSDRAGILKPRYMIQDSAVSSRRGPRFWQVVRFLILVFAIVTPFRYFVAQPFIVSGASMEPTFDAHEYLVIDQWSYRREKPERGDVVVFKYPLDPSTYFIKRIVGLPGETVYIEGGSVRVALPNETPTDLVEPYRHGDMAEDSTIALASDEYFVLGDNRDASSDSRVWGPLQEKYILGRPILRLFPFTEAELDPGAHQFVE